MMCGMQATLIRKPELGLVHEWAIADDLCPQIRSLLPAARTRLLPLGCSENPLSLISQVLSGQPIDTLHVVAHGRSGAIALGGQWIDAKALLANAAGLARWKVRRLALWSCDVGRDADFVALLAELTGAEVWTSSRPLGAGERWALQANHPHAGTDHEPAPMAPFADAAVAAWPHQLNAGKCPKPFITELAGVLISNPLQIKGTRVQQNEITLATSQPNVDPGSIFFRQTNSDQNGNNLLGTLSFREENGNDVEIKGELSRQVKGVDSKPQDVEAYYFVADDLSFAYLLVTFTKDGSTENLNFFQPGGTYKTSSDFKCESYFSADAIEEILDPGTDPAPEEFSVPTISEDEDPNPGDNGDPGGNGGGDGGGGQDQGNDPFDLPITVLDDEGNILPEESYTIDRDPDTNKITIDLEDANPDKPGDQPFDDGTYEVFIGDKELGKIDVNNEALNQAFGGPCIESIFAARNKELLSSSRSNRNSRRRSDRIIGRSSNRLEASAHADAVDVLTGTAGQDVYRLSDSAGALHARHGNHDYARISGFGAEDKLVLHGKSTDYTLGGLSSVDGQMGHALAYRGDMIALIQGDGGIINSLRSDLNSSQINYV